jgi:hypothetical protein
LDAAEEGLIGLVQSRQRRVRDMAVDGRVLRDPLREHLMDGLHLGYLLIT